jgi:hypothetical protein
MGIVCSTDDTASWTKTFKSNEAADADPFAPVTFGDNGDTANPYDNAPAPRSTYYPPPVLDTNASKRGSSAHPRAY